MSTDDVLIVGGGLAGLSAAIFTARAGLTTRVLSDGESILARNAHLENFPGFPAGINPRLLLEMTRSQAENAGTTLTDGRVESVDHGEHDVDGFVTRTKNGEAFAARRVIAASWSDTAYLDPLDFDLIDRGSKSFIDVDSTGHTSVPGVYAAGRLAEQYHQAVVAAGHGAQVGLTVIEDSDVPFYHDWVVPEGYFTGRDRDVPPGCAEIDETERQRREAASLETMREYVAEPHPGEPTMHPSVEQ